MEPEEEGLAAAGGGGEASVSLEEACERLRIRPYLFRTLAQQQPEIFRTVLEAGERRVRVGDLAAMERFLARRAGRTEEAARPGETAEEPAGAEEEEARSPEERLARVEARLARLEEALASERDQWLTSLTRLQQEVRQLRYELAAATPRRARRRFRLPGFGKGGGLPGETAGPGSGPA
ncbi:MAG: hypothetical protein IRZ26_02030 [Clostridia bacterium]|nr:hypothetical protein [Clostridia bacterium]